MLDIATCLCSHMLTEFLQSVQARHLFNDNLFCEVSIQVWALARRSPAHLDLSLPRFVDYHCPAAMKTSQYIHCYYNEQNTIESLFGDLYFWEKTCLEKPLSWFRLDLFSMGDLSRQVLP